MLQGIFLIQLRLQHGNIERIESDHFQRKWIVIKS